MNTEELCSNCKRWKWHTTSKEYGNCSNGKVRHHLFGCENHEYSAEFLQSKIIEDKEHGTKRFVSNTGVLQLLCNSLRNYIGRDKARLQQLKDYINNYII